MKYDKNWKLKTVGGPNLAQGHDVGWQPAMLAGLKAWVGRFGWPSLAVNSTRSTRSPYISASVDVSYAALHAHGIINVTLQQEYSPGIIFIFF
jgi:hypothetical protein